MDISPISAIRPVVPVKLAPSAPDLSRVFEVEYLGQSDADEYTPAHGKPTRGLEDEESENAAEAPDVSEDTPYSTAYGTVSLFA